MIIHHCWQFVHDYPRFSVICLNLFRIIWDVSGGSLEVPRSNFCRKYFRVFFDPKSVWEGPGGSQESPRPSYKIFNFPENSYFRHGFLWPIVLPIVLPIAFRDPGFLVEVSCGTICTVIAMWIQTRVPKTKLGFKVI